MIANQEEYQRACEELQHLEEWLGDLREKHPNGQKGLTKAGVRKMIARLHEELAYYEGHQEVKEKAVMEKK